MLTLYLCVEFSKIVLSKIDVNQHFIWLQIVLYFFKMFELAVYIVDMPFVDCHVLTELFA